MSVLSKRKTVENPEISRIQREVTPLAGEIRYISTGDLLTKKTGRGRPGSTVRDMIAIPSPSGRRVRLDERMGNYLSGSLETTQPMRLEQRLTRNRIVVVAVFFAVLLFWALARFL